MEKTEQKQQQQKNNISFIYFYEVLIQRCQIVSAL